MFSGFLKLDRRDIINGIVVAVIGAVGGTLYQATLVEGFDIFSYDWMGVAKLAVNAAMIYFVKNLLTAKDGKVLGRI